MAMAVLLLCVPGRDVLGQSTYGALTGTVSDSAGAVLPSARIEAINEATSSSRMTVADAAGDYQFLNIEPGNYAVVISATGFASVRNEHIIVPSRETVRVDGHLKVSATTVQVEVVGGQEVVSEDLTVSNSLSGGEIDALALNFRATNAPSPINAAVLTPTVTLDPGGNLTFAGQVPTATSFSLDGISIQQTRVGGPTKDLFPSVESIAEFRVNTAGDGAEYAQPTDLTVTSKGGSNNFHGSGFWYLQRAGWNSTDLIAQAPVSLNANTYGLSVGGPIFKDKTFFFFDWEHVSLANNTNIQLQTIPTAWANGDFTSEGTGGAESTGLILYNPATGEPLPSNNLAALGIAPNPIAAIAFAKLFPAPAGANANETVLDSPSASPNYQANFPGSYKSDVFDGRIDQVFNAHHHIFGRVTKKDITVSGTDSPTGDSAYNPVLGTYATTSDLTNVAFSHNWIINSHLLNEARGGWSRMNFGFSYPLAAQGDSIIGDMQTAGLQPPAGITLGHPLNGLGGVPVFYTGNLIGGQGTGTDTASNTIGGHPRLNNNSVVEVGDIVSFSRNRLNAKVGGSFRRVGYRDNITFLEGDEYGDYFNDGLIPCSSGEDGTYFNACSVAELYLGLQDGTSAAQNGPDGKPYSHHWDAFGQFDLKLSQRLTVNLGLRYEVNTPFIDESNQLGNFDYNFPKGRLVVNPNEKISTAWAETVGDIPGGPGTLPTVGNATGIPGIPFVYGNQVGLGNGLRYLDTANIQPRAGVVWKPFRTHETVIKGSGGIYSVPVLGAVLYSLLGVDTSNFASYGPGLLSTVYTSGGSAGAFPGYRRANQWDLKDPSVGQWNASIEQNIGFRTDLKIGYIGSHTWNLIYSPDLNQVAPNTTGYANLVATPDLRVQNLKFPNFREVLTRANGPWANYNAVSIEANRRFAQGLSFTNAFTVTSNKTNALGTAPNSAIATGGQGDNGGNVNNAFDIKSDYGNAFYDPRFRFLSTVVYELPIGRGRQFMGAMNEMEDRLLGGWSITGFNLYHSGFWLTPYFPSGAYDPSGTKPSNRSVSQQRPDSAAGISTKGSKQCSCSSAVYFNAAAFSFPGTTPGMPAPGAPIGRFGNAQVGALEGPKTESFSMSIGKNLPLAEHFVLRYEAQFSNLFNFVNANNPNMNITGSFGQITSSQGPQSQAGPRSIQMSLRLSY
jgi:Carboxypeptidase regulatory-like domain